MTEPSSLARAEPLERHIRAPLLGPTNQRPLKTLEDFIDSAWAKLSRPEFKAVIEVWLAARNDPALAGGLRPVIEKYKRIFSIGENEQLRRRIGASKEVQAFYHLACETMIGLALGRATTQGSAPLSHEKTVIDQLRTLARKVTR